MMSTVATVGWSLPPGWLAWAHGDIASAETQASGSWDAGPRAALIAAVRRFEGIVTADMPGTTCAALWSPEKAGGVPLASAALRVFGSEPSAGSRLEDVLERARTEITVPRGVRLLDVAALPGAVTAGEAVLQIVDTSPRLRRRVSREWSWFILPPGTTDLVLVHVESPAVAHFDEIAEMTTAIAHSVTVTLEPA